MISILVKCDCVNDPVSGYEEAVETWSGFCPVCGAYLRKHGTYVRNTPREVGPLRIQRLYCSADKTHGTHSLIPCFVLPYQQSLAEDQNMAIVAIAEQTDTLEQLAEKTDVDPRTIARWWCYFFKCSVGILRYLARLLAESSMLASHWSRGFMNDNAHSYVLRVIQLIRQYREQFFRDFDHCDFSLLSLLNPYLFVTRYSQ